MSSDKPFNAISFQFENYTKFAQLNIEPKPDHLIRVFMVIRPMNSKHEIEIEEQIIPEIKRDELQGFVAVEWGGPSHDHSLNHFTFH